MVQSLVREQPDGVKRVSHQPWPNHTHLSDTSTPIPRSDGVKMNPEPHLSVCVCDIWEEILRITRRRTGEISKCERTSVREGTHYNWSISMWKSPQEQWTMEQQLIIRILVKEQERNRHRSIWMKNWIFERIKAISFSLIISKYHLLIAVS